MHHEINPAFGSVLVVLALFSVLLGVYQAPLMAWIATLHY